MRVEEWSEGQLISAYDDGHPEPAAPADLDALRDQIANATTLAGLRAAVLDVVDAITPEPVPDLRG